MRRVAESTCNAGRGGLFALQSILDAADGVLNLTLNLVRLAFCVQLGIANNLTNGRFHFALNDFCRADYAIFIHDKSLFAQAHRRIAKRPFRQGERIRCGVVPLGWGESLGRGGGQDWCSCRDRTGGKSRVCACTHPRPIWSMKTHGQPLNLFQRWRPQSAACQITFNHKCPEQASFLLRPCKKGGRNYLSSRSDFYAKWLPLHVRSDRSEQLLGSFCQTICTASGLCLTGIGLFRPGGG